MIYRALVSFSGKLSMAMGEVREISNKSIVDDLLKAGYIEELKETKIKKDEDPGNTTVKKGRRKRNEN